MICGFMCFNKWLDLLVANHDAAFIVPLLFFAGNRRIFVRRGTNE